MSRKNFIEIPYQPLPLLYLLDEAIVALWVQSGRDTASKRVARQEITTFAFCLPKHQRRSELLDDYITRKILEEISLRFAVKLAPAVPKPKELPETITIDELDIRDDVWEVVSSQVGGFSKCSYGIVGRPWDIDGESCLVYRLHHEYIDPRLRTPRHEHWENYRCIHVDHLGVSVYVEFNLLVIADVVIEGIVKRAIERKYRSYRG